MRSIIDKTTNLEWISFIREEIPLIDEYSDYIRQINTWSNNKYMKKYISNDPIGNEMDFWFRLASDTDIYLAKNDNEIIAVALLGHNRPLMRQAELANYIVHKRHLDESLADTIPNENYLQEDDINTLLKDRDKDNIYVEYLLVNPKYHGKGIATHFYKFMKENLDFFGGHNISFLQVSVSEENIPSRKSILKNGFRRMKPTTEIPTYSTYYLHKRDLEKTKDII